MDRRDPDAHLPAGTYAALTALPGAALRSVLLAVARDRAARTTPRDVLRAWHDDRFVRPAQVDPRRVAALEHRIWSLLPSDWVGVELSPVAPLGTSSALGPVSQDRAVTTMRLTEVVSDPTNALAVEAAARRRAVRARPVHLAASHRVLRPQRFAPGAPSHFRLLSLVSSARDTGSGRTEADLLGRHLLAWATVLAATAPGHGPTLLVTSFTPGAVRERLADTVLPALADAPVRVVEDTGRDRGHGYYTDAAVRLVLRRADGEEHEVGDGGLTTWTAALLGDAKERCLVTCVSLDALASLHDAT